jgi:hypothetical protein
MKKLFNLISVLVLASMILAACAPQATPTAEPTTVPPTDTTVPPADTTVPPTDTAVPPTETTAPPTDTPAPAWTAPEGALVAVPVDAAPTLDGVGDDAAWANATAIVIPVMGGANFDGTGSTEISLKAVYTADSVYFLATWSDPTQSFFRSPWQKQADGTWSVVKDENDKGGDNNAVYEDKLAFIWNINNSIVDFNTTGCGVACHAGENPDIKPFGNKYTAAEGEMGDIWHWKSIRSDGQLDDQYLDWVRLDTTSEDTIKATKEAGLATRGWRWLRR